MPFKIRFLTEVTPNDERRSRGILIQELRDWKCAVEAVLERMDLVVSEWKKPSPTSREFIAVVASKGSRGDDVTYRDAAQAVNKIKFNSGRLQDIAGCPVYSRLQLAFSNAVTVQSTNEIRGFDSTAPGRRIVNRLDYAAPLLRAPLSIEVEAWKNRVRKAAEDAELSDIAFGLSRKGSLIVRLQGQSANAFDIFIQSYQRRNQRALALPDSAGHVTGFAYLGEYRGPELEFK